MSFRMMCTSVALLVAAPVALLAQEEAKKGAAEPIDKKVVEIVKTVGDFYKNAKSYHADATIVTKTDGGNGPKELSVKAVYDAQKPDRLSLRTQMDGDGQKGPDVIADGKHLFLYRKAVKQYTEQDTPASMGEIALTLLRDVGPIGGGILFGHILSDDPAELLMQGVNSCSYAGKDKVDGKDVHRLKFSQDQFDWELWVASEGDPYVLRLISTRERGDAKATTTENYSNWKLNGEPAKDLFTFAPPKDATKVDEFNRSGAQ